MTLTEAYGWVVVHSDLGVQVAQELDAWENARRQLEQDVLVSGALPGEFRTETRYTPRGPGARMTPFLV